jgi:hypothetical protein
VKIIWNPDGMIGNTISAITAQDSDSNYPDDNLLDENVGLIWKSAVAPGGGPYPNKTLSFSCVSVVGMTTAIAIFGITGATSVSIAASYTISGQTTSLATQTFNMHPSAAVYYDRIWAEYAPVYIEGAPTSVTFDFVVTLTGYYQFSAADVVGGAVITFPDPQYGLTQSRIDKSIKQELAGGGYYIHDALKPRTMNLSWVMGRDTDFDELDSLYNIRGSKPLAMLISEALENDMKWCGYFHMTDAPTATHDMPSFSAVSLSIREAC